MRHFTRDLLHRLADIHHEIEVDNSLRDGDEGVHFSMHVNLLTGAGHRAYHERLLERRTQQLGRALGLNSAQIQQATSRPPTPQEAVDARKIIANVHAKVAAKKRKR
jgi:hypothetical protein